MTLAGRLLIASPVLVDPNFMRSVVMMLQHDAEGTVGVVLNRPTDEEVADHLLEWDEVAVGPIHYGGPVGPEVAIGIAEGGTESVGVIGLGLVDLGEPPDPAVIRAKVYAGYAGWDQGQLEAEIAEGSWYVAAAHPDDPFRPPAAMWAAVLRRQRGPLALVSTFPIEVDMN